jgi:hypothetical protein
MKKTALLVAAVAGLASTASAQNWNLGNLAVTDVIQGIDLNGAAVTPGSYNFVEVSLDWVVGGGNPWSVEAIFALTSDDFSGGVGTPTFYSDPGTSPDALNSGDPVTLTWSTFLDVDYNGGDSLWFNTLQTFSGSDATWNNVSVTLSNMGITAPTATDLGCFDAGDFDINTEFSTFDTEMGLYDASGALLANNDDAIGLQSQILATLAEGTYYIAVGGFNSGFAGAFGATGGGASGDISLQINGATLANDVHAPDTISWYSIKVIPSPASASMLALGGLVAARRRR